jgi:hypothetical protein
VKKKREEVKEQMSKRTPTSFGFGRIDRKLDKKERGQ